MWHALFLFLVERRPKYGHYTLRDSDTEVLPMSRADRPSTDTGISAQELALIAEHVEQIATELVVAGNLSAGQWIVIGASTSEVAGRHIGTSGSEEVAAQVYAGLERVRAKHGVVLIYQCCEHLNRALVLEKSIAERSGLDAVSVIPAPRAGGAMAAYAYRHMQEPCVVEAVRAHAGIDIGGTLIGMHLRPVAVPVRSSIGAVGAAHVTMAYSRPKLIGGARAVYIMQTETEFRSPDCNHG